MVVAPGPLGSQDDDGLGPRIVRAGGPRSPYDGTYHLLTRIDKVHSRVRAERPDVLEAHSPYLAGAAVAACRRHARVRTAFWHSDHVATYVQPLLARWIGPRGDAVASAVARRLSAALLAPFDATFVAGHGQAAQLRAAGVRRVVEIPFGIDTETFRPETASEQRRNELLDGAPASASLLVGVGRFAIEKRWDVVLDAVAHLQSRRRVVLALFGDGPERTSLERRAPPGVRFLGFETDRARLASALASADVLVHACPCETSGIVVAEAVASGLPVVAPDQGGAAENLDPSCGETYRSGDPERCAAAVDRLLGRNRNELRARARDAAGRAIPEAQHFSRVLAAYSDLLRERV